MLISSKEDVCCYPSSTTTPRQPLTQITMGVAKLHFDVLTGLYVPSGDIITSAVRRAVSHPATAGFVKRAVDNGEEPIDLDMPVWGIVLLGVSFYAAIIGMSLVSLPTLDWVSIRMQC